MPRKKQIDSSSDEDPTYGKREKKKKQLQKTSTKEKKKQNISSSEDEDATFQPPLKEKWKNTRQRTASNSESDQQTGRRTPQSMERRSFVASRTRGSVEREESIGSRTRQSMERGDSTASRTRESVEREESVASRTRRSMERRSVSRQFSRAMSIDEPNEGRKRSQRRRRVLSSSSDDEEPVHRRREVETERNQDSVEKSLSSEEEMEIDDLKNDPTWTPKKKRLPRSEYREEERLALSESEDETAFDTKQFMEDRLPLKNEICQLNQLRSCPYCYAIHFDIYDEREEQMRVAKNPQCKERICCDKFQQFVPHVCCSGGQVFIPPWRKLPKEIYSLLFGDTRQSREFRKQIVSYNTCFSLASIQRHKVKSAPFGLPVEKTLGLTRHFPSAALPNDPNRLRYGNYYLYQGEDAANRRKDEFQRLDKKILIKLQSCIDYYSPWAELFKTMGEVLKEVQQADGYDDRVRLRIIDSRQVKPEFLTGNHPGIYRPPKSVGKDKEFVALFYEETQDKEVYPPGLIIYPRRNNKEPRPLFPWDSRVNSFCYPLLFPHGEPSYRMKDFPLMKDHTLSYPHRLGFFAKHHPDIARKWEVEGASPEEMLQVYEANPPRAHHKQSNEGDPNLSAEENEDDDMADFYRQEIESTKEEGSVERVQMVERGGQLYPNGRGKAQGEQTKIQTDPDADLENNMDEDIIDGDLMDDLDFDDLPQMATGEDLTIVNDDEEDENSEENQGDQPTDERPTSTETEQREKKSQERTHASLKQWGLYIHQQRGVITDRNEKTIWIKNRFSSMGKVGQIFLIDLCTRLYQQRHAKQKEHHMEFLASNKTKFLEALNKRAQRHGRTIGCVASVPNSIPGSPRHLQQLFEKTVAMSRTRHGKPDLFITVTANVDWPEIKENLAKGETWADHPFLVNEVFKKKFDKLLELIVGEKTETNRATYHAGIFGKVRWYSYSIEFQQRGPPHAHLVLSLKNHIKSAEQIDNICQAYLPKVNRKSSPKEKEIRQLVEDLMIHRPCEGDQDAYCRKSQRVPKVTCRKHFPKMFTNTTRYGDRNYPEYKRPNSGETATTSDGLTVDNRYVVPYNPELLYYFKSHMNIEVVSNLRVVKYIFKYLFKGYDRVLVEAITKSDTPDTSQMTIEGHLIYPKALSIPAGAINRRKDEAIKLLKDNGVPLKDANGKETLVYDEFTMIEDQRALTSCEAAWEFAGYLRHGESHVVQQLYVHGEDQEPIIYKRDEQEATEQRIMENPDIRTRFKEWFELNKRDPEARKFTYPEIVKNYKFANGKWLPKVKKRHDLFGHVKAVHPRNTEVFAIRLLSSVQVGVQNFDELRTVNGDKKPTFVAAAKALRLMNDQQEWDNALYEASSERIPLTLRRMFASILVFNTVKDPLFLWTKYQEDFFERRNDWSTAQKKAHALRHIESFLKAHLTTLKEYKLPEYNPEDLPVENEWIDDSGFNNISVKAAEKKAAELLCTLNDEQRNAYDEIVEDIIHKREDKCYFIQGSGGAGKTRLMKTLLYDLIAKKRKVICVAHTGVAAKLLPYGTTAHRAFQIPLAVEADMKCAVDISSDEATYLQEVDVVLWDEATMTDRRIFKAVHDLFCDLHSEKDVRLFGGTRFIFGGDWKQTLPIVQGVYGDSVVDYTIKGSDLWNNTKVLQLNRNMRAEKDPHFADWLFGVGEGTENFDKDDEPERDQHVMLNYGTITPSENQLIERVFGDLEGNLLEKTDQFKSSAILAVDNKTTFDINHKVLEITKQTIEVKKSIDEHDPSRGFAHLDPDVYHGETPSGLPLHELELVIGAPVILLRNISTKMGLVNGTRMIVEEIKEDIIWVRPLDGNEHTPKRWPLTRMRFAPCNTLSREQAFIRTQYPIRLAFSMTCNKAQGQTLEKVGLLLRTPCFTHGQLYVALSRVCNAKSLFIYNANGEYVRDSALRKEMHKTTNNVVFRKAIK